VRGVCEIPAPAVQRESRYCGGLVMIVGASC
jgi:hypothetical protein